MAMPGCMCGSAVLGLILDELSQGSHWRLIHTVRICLVFTTSYRAVTCTTLRSNDLAFEFLCRCFSKHDMPVSDSPGFFKIQIPRPINSDSLEIAPKILFFLTGFPDDFYAG